MQNRIDTLFKNKKKDILSVYFTAGHPEPESTVKIIKILAQHGVDMIEIGMPFSDPMADGPVIQKSSEKAIKNGMSLPHLFEQLKNIRQEVDLPLLLMGYLNPVMQMGIETFLENCASTGIDGTILPDLPLDEYAQKYKPLFEQKGLYNIFLISPQTTEARIKQIDAESNGFIYMVSSAAVTGAKSTILAEQEEYFTRINQMRLKNNTLIGFGISNNETFAKACSYAQGAIIGSAFIRVLEQDGDLEENIKMFVQSITTKSPAL